LRFDVFGEKELSRKAVQASFQASARAGSGEANVRVKLVSKYLFGGLLLFFFFEYMRPGTYFPPLEAAKMNTVIPIALFLFTLFSSAGRPQEAVFKSATAKWFLFFVALFPLQLFTVDVKLYVWEAFKAIVGYLLIYYVIIRQVTDLRRIRSVFATLVLIHVLLTILNPKLVLEPENRTYIAGVTFLGDGNDFAWSACIVLPFALYLAQSSAEIKIKYFYYSLFMLLVLAIIGTQSRGGSIAFGGVVLYLWLRSRKKMVGLVALTALVGVALMFAPEAYFERMYTIKDYETEGSAQGRINAWKSAMRMAEDHPFLGVGAEHFAVKYGTEYRPPGVGRTEIPWANAHSIYFKVLGEFGYTGFLILVGLLGSLFVGNEQKIDSVNRLTGNDRNIRQLAIAFQGSLIGYSLGGMFLSGIFYPHLFVISSLCEASRAIVKQEFPR
jgi:probable O-glycosylation ligase (exosortase A-associated)